MFPHDSVKPDYGARCFADIPSTIQHLLTGTGKPLLSRDILQPFAHRYETVILFFIDSFGWRFFEKYVNGYPFLQRMERDGAVHKLTSQFPPTTAAHTTAIHTGLHVGQSGLFAWQYYEPTLDAMITPLLFSYAGSTQRDTLSVTGIDPAELYPRQTVYRTLKQHGVSSTILQHAEYTPSTYSDVVFDGADQVVPYRTLPEALTNLHLLLAQRQTPSYFFLYFDKIDAICHTYGPNSPQVEAEIDALLTTLDRLFEQKLRGRLNKTLFVLVADHGQAETDPQTTIYLNLDARFAEVVRHLKTDQRGAPLVAAGSPRDMYLYLKEGYLEEAYQRLQKELHGVADVVYVRDLIEQGYFGPPPASAALRSRIGDLVILPYRYESVWWYEKDRFEQKYYGHHGGLSAPEMEIPLCLYEF